MVIQQNVIWVEEFDAFYPLAFVTLQHFPLIDIVSSDGLCSLPTPQFLFPSGGLGIYYGI